MDQDKTWHAGRPPPWPHCVRWGPSSPSPKGVQPPPSNFRPIPIVAKWLDGLRIFLKMPLDMEVGLGQGDFVLDRDPAPSSTKKGRSPSPNFRLMSIVAKRLDGSRWHLAWSGPRFRPHCARLGPSRPSQKGAEPPPPIFGQCLLWPIGWMDQDRT